MKQIKYPQHKTNKMTRGLKTIHLGHKQYFECGCGYISRKYTNPRGFNLARRLHEKKCIPATEETYTPLSVNVTTCETKSKSN